MDNINALPWLHSVFDAAEGDLFASSHTGLPAIRRFPLAADLAGWVLNTGVAG